MPMCSPRRWYNCTDACWRCWFEVCTGVLISP